MHGTVQTLCGPPTKMSDRSSGTDFMSLYDFRISQGSSNSSDEVDLPSDEEARGEAMAVFGDLARNFVQKLQTDSWRLEVVDASGKCVFRLSANAEYDL